MRLVGGYLFAALFVLAKGHSTRPRIVGLVRDETLVVRENRAIGNAIDPGFVHYDAYQDDEQQLRPTDADPYYEQDDVDDERDEDDDKRLTSFLDDLAHTKRLQDGQRNPFGLQSNRRGRRRKLNSHEQGMILVEALGKRQKNFTSINDHRGHQSPDVHNGIMDMLGRSTVLFLFGLLVLGSL